MKLYYEDRNTDTDYTKQYIVRNTNSVNEKRSVFDQLTGKYVYHNLKPSAAIKICNTLNKHSDVLKVHGRLILMKGGK